MSSVELAPQTDAVRVQLERMAASEEFAGSERRRDLLRHIVEASLDGDQSELKAYVIGTKVLGRPSGFNPQVDPIVRVEIGRLRATLDRYYRAHPNDPIVVSIPRGQYAAGFSAPPAEADGTPDATGSTLPRAIGILPLTDLGSDPELGYVSTGISEELALALTRATDVEVVAGLPSDVFDAATESPTDLAERLPVRFLLHGSVVATADRVRILARLYDRVGDRDVWSDRIESDLGDLHPFEATDRIVAGIVGRIGGGFGVVSRVLHDGRTTEQGRTVDAYDALLRYHHAMATPSEKLLDRAASALERTDDSRDDPRILAALADIAFVTWWLWIDPSPERLDRAEDLADRAIRLAPEEQVGHMVMAYVHFGRRNHRAFRLELDRGLDLNCTLPEHLGSAGLLLALSGDLQRGSELCTAAVELNPYFPPWWHIVPCLSAIQRRDDEYALFEARQVATAGAHVGPLLLAGLLGRLDRVSEAVTAATEVEELVPGFATRRREILERVFHDPAVVTYLEEGLDRALPPTG